MSDGKRPGDNEVFLSDLSKLWEETRDTLESFGNRYLSASAELDDNKMSGPEWLEKNVDLAGRLWLIWFRGASTTVQRTMSAGLERAEKQRTKAERKDEKNAKKKAGQVGDDKKRAGR